MCRLRKLGVVTASLLGALTLPHTVMAKEPLSSLTAETALQCGQQRFLLNSSTGCGTARFPVGSGPIHQRFNRGLSP